MQTTSKPSRLHAAKQVWSATVAWCEIVLHCLSEKRCSMQIRRAAHQHGMRVRPHSCWMTSKFRAPAPAQSEASQKRDQDLKVDRSAMSLHLHPLKLTSRLRCRSSLEERVNVRTSQHSRAPASCNHTTALARLPALRCTDHSAASASSQGTGRRVGEQQLLGNFSPLDGRIPESQIHSATLRQRLSVVSAELGASGDTAWAPALQGHGSSSR